MSKSWLKCQFKLLPDEEMRDIPNPTTELLVHVTTKTVQAGSVIALLTTGLKTAISGPRTMETLLKTGTRYGINGMAIGLVLGPVFTYMKARSCDDDGMYDRCYRLRYNRNQVRVDLASVAGVGIGVCASMFFGYGIATGVVFGMPLGVLDGAIYNKIKNDKHH